MKNETLFYKKLFVLVLPIAFQNLMSALVGASDAIMLGILNQESLSAVSLATQVQFVLSLFYAALTIGTTILSAQYWGKKDYESVEQVLAVALKSSIFISTIFFLSATIFPEFLMRIFTNDTTLISMGVAYLRAVGWSYLFSGISQIYLCVMKNTGRTLKSTVISSTSMILNIMLNAVLIFGLFGVPEFGILGAAVATEIARAVELLWVLSENRRAEKGKIRLRLLFKSSSQLKKDFYRYTSPVLANELVWGCGFTMFSVIMGHLGNDAVAANSIANIVKNLIACFCMGIAAGSGIIVGNELGSGNLTRAKEYGTRLCKLSVVTGIISGFLLWLCIPLIMKGTGSLSVQAHHYLREMLYMCSYYMIGKSINSTAIAGIFCAGGDTKFGLFCDIITMWVIIVPIGLLSAFVFQWPILVVYFLLNLDEMIKLPAVYIHYKKYHWVKNITRK